MGNIGFFEVRVDDFQRAQKFYHDVFGWEFSKSGGVPYEFYMIDTVKPGDGGNQEGGMRKREKPLAPESDVSGYICYIMVEAIDAALEKIAHHGGKVTTPKAQIPAGYFAYALDTEGNALECGKSQSNGEFPYFISYRSTCGPGPRNHITPS